jgi:hypothetical protein
VEDAGTCKELVALDRADPMGVVLGVIVLDESLRFSSGQVMPNFATPPPSIHVLGDVGCDEGIEKCPVKSLQASG